MLQINEYDDDDDDDDDDDVFLMYYCTFCVLHYDTCIGLGY